MKPESTVKVLDNDRQLVSDTMHKFYQLLPGNIVDAFDIKTADEATLTAFKKNIDGAQEHLEAIEAMRLRLDSVFTEGELADLPYAKLQRIAKERGLKAKQSAAILVKELTGVNKSIRPVEQYRECLGRIGWARSKANYKHPRQIEAAKTRSQ